MLPPFGNFNGVAIEDGEGFAPPNYNGPIAVKHNTIAYTDTTAKNLFSLPKGAVIVALIVNVRTAFNSSGTDLLDIGDTATPARFKNDLDVASAGQVLTGFVPAELFTPLTDDIIVTGLFAQSVADASAGLADVACLYYLT